MGSEVAGHCRAQVAARGDGDRTRKDTAYAGRTLCLAQRAEGEGFEPSSGVNPKRFSRPPHSTALPPLPREAGRYDTTPRGEVAERLKATAC